MRKKELVLFTIIALFFIVILFATLWQLKVNRSLKKQLSSKNEDLDKAKKANQRLEELEHQLQLLKQKEAQLNKVVPPGEKEPLSLIKSIIRVSADIKLSLKSFTLAKNASTVNAAGTPDASGAQGIANITPLYLEVNFEATYPQVIVFLEKIKKLTRFVDVTEIILKGDNVIVPRQAVTMKLTTYTSIKQ